MDLQMVTVDHFLQAEEGVTVAPCRNHQDSEHTCCDFIYEHMKDVGKPPIVLISQQHTIVGGVHHTTKQPQGF